jgi:nanoRNase/pAp phosphatase (c-di-AMP/oligoRNAs hydrolase)
MIGETIMSLASDILQNLTSMIKMLDGVARIEVLVAFGAGIVLLVILVKGYRRTRPNGRVLKKKLSTLERIVILTHSNPDPDAMASALGIAHIAESMGVAVTIQYPGEIRHQENRAFKTVLGTTMEKIESDEDIAGGAIFLVDHNVARGFQGAEKLIPYAVIDHHSGEGRGVGFTDIRPEYGSCSAIITEYFLDIGAVPEEAGQPKKGRIRLPKSVATGLLFGILTDTKNFTKGASEADFSASAYLYGGIDEDSLDRIANPEVDAEVLEIIASSILKREARGPFVISNVGEVSNIDALSQAADELLNLEGTTAVVVYGQKGATTHVKGRSRDDRVHMGDTLQAALAHIPEASAGGKPKAGAGQINASTKKQNREYCKELPECLFTAMTGEVQ